MSAELIDEIRAAFDEGLAIPYLGPGVLELAGDACTVPASPAALVARLTEKASVPHKIRDNLTAAAQFIENFKHRNTVKAAMTEAFTNEMEPTDFHRYLAALPKLPLLVHAWYDDLPNKALASRSEPWGVAQGISQTEHYGHWIHYFESDATLLPNPPESKFSVESCAPAMAPDEVKRWATLLYEPLGSIAPAQNYLVSDTDFVEVLTEIDIQTPVPEPVRDIRKGRHFLFLGCRFGKQLDRLWARQVSKRSSDFHWAVLPGELTKNELRFLEEKNIKRIDMTLEAFAEALMGSGAKVETQQPEMALGA
ncbi:SIR2 family protein [Methyloceanibacter sp. wino2]|uniref:SIR2 family protein n=1 Tax=Methyloceanibacter sp. wino2 TaxID=2170729 RepID=UPI000D3EC24A|nr:SIR2 family protein [Methyloceanibacter sp. wino2]